MNIDSLSNYRFFINYKEMTKEQFKENYDTSMITEISKGTVKAYSLEEWMEDHETLDFPGLASKGCPFDETTFNPN